LSIKELNERPNMPNFYDSRVVWYQEHVGRALREESVDLYFGPAFMTPIKRNCPAVVTVHDLIFITHPEFCPPGSPEYFRKWGKLSAESAQGIIAVSQSTKEAIVSHWRIPESKITVTQLAVGDEFKPVEDERKIKDVYRKYGLRDRFMLYVGGTYHPRKNVSTLIKAFILLREDLRREYQLAILTGSRDWGESEKIRIGNLIASITSDMNIIENVIITDFVPQDELVILYNAATVFVYPSICEGFGLPPLEAMSCGTPVVTSNAPAINEVVGDAGVLVNPLDASEMAGALEKVLLNPDLREELSSKGLKRSKDFSWERTARGTLEAFKRAMRG
jgi:glycosyltransferase involved in cell wall biosynthesis